jgi:hypothetical protein
MNIIEVQHAFQEESGLPRDQIVNTFHFIRTDSGDGDTAALALAVRNFFMQPETGASTESLYVEFLGTSIAALDASIKVYRMSDPTPRSPIYSTTYSPTTVSGGSAQPDTIPTEVAMCLSYHSAFPGDSGGMVVAPGATKISAVGRHRGRIYIGPISSSATDTDGRPKVLLGDKLIRIARRLYAEATAEGFEWCVFSPTNTKHSGTPIGAVIATISYDDAWDTQRRRGKQPTVRNSFAVVP